MEYDENFTALTKDERRKLTLELSDKLLIMAHQNPAAFLENSGPQINKFLDMATRLDEVTDTKPLPLTREQLREMSTDDIKHWIVAYTVAHANQEVES